MDHSKFYDNFKKFSKFEYIHITRTQPEEYGNSETMVVRIQDLSIYCHGMQR